MQYAYFIGSCAAFGIWFIPYVLRPDLRKELWFGSSIGLPFALINIMYVPNYWHPPTLFDLMATYGVSIEDFMLAFVIGGVTCVLYDVVFNLNLIKTHTFKLHYLIPLAAFVMLHFGLGAFFYRYVIWTIIIAFIAGSSLTLIWRPDLYHTVLLGGISFAVLYTLFFYFFTTVFSGFVDQFYSIENLSGITLVGVPLEEILFALTGGAYWSTQYKFINGYSAKPL